VVQVGCRDRNLVRGEMQQESPCQVRVAGRTPFPFSKRKCWPGPLARALDHVLVSVCQGVRPLAGRGNSRRLVRSQAIEVESQVAQAALSGALMLHLLARTICRALP
jgi:hypothetical protein